MSLTDARQVTPVEFFGGSHRIQYAPGEGFNAEVEPTEADLAALEAELAEPPATVPVDATSVDPEPPDPAQPPPSPDDPECLVQPATQEPVGKAKGTPAKS